jgi:hypothetical protein
MLEFVLRDMKFAVRQLRCNAGFTAVAILSLGLGVGANTAIFSLVKTMLLAPLPYPEGDRLVMVWEDVPRWDIPRNTPAPANFLDWRAQNHVFESMAAFMGGIFGALLGASMWRAVGLEPSLCWAGALTGLVGFGLLSFILFKASVMMYTSLQGSVMLIFGILGLVYKYQDIAPKLTESMTLKPFLLPVSIFIPALLGLIYQQTQFAGAEGATAKKK